MKLVSFALVLLCVCNACTALDYLSSGFAHAKLNDGTTQTFQVHDFYDKPISIDSFELIKVPSHVGLDTSMFTRMKGKEINDHPVYFNGRFYIFFLSNAEPYGTWLLGDKLGVDSGIAFLRPDVHTLVPLDIENDKCHWKFLRDGQWKSDSNARIRAASTEDGGSVPRRIRYHTISYFRGGNSVQSVVLMSSVDRDEYEEEVGSALFQFSPNLSAHLPPLSWDQNKYPIFWNLETNSWISFALSFVIPRGVPVRLSTSTGHGKGVSSQLVHLVGDEMTGEGWRLFLRKSDMDSGDELEIKLTLSRTGLADNYTVKSLKKLKELKSFAKSQSRKIGGTEVGSYMWVWVHASPETLGESRHLAISGGDFLLKCVAKVIDHDAGRETYVFEYHHSHRRVAMDRSVLSSTTSLMTAQWNNDISSFEWSLDGAPLIADAVFTLGPDPVTWLRDYLISHEGFLAPGLSSCFMYHGGLSMPQQLIYAAELVCVLIGSKPMTMIQYTSSADHQWKFPLVPELTRAIVSGLVLHSPLATALQVTYNTYQETSETVIISRTSKQDMLHLIRPNNTAQALHIVPFPSEAKEGDSERMDTVLREQIYNSWWNGFLLGYPERFIDSYLRSFHTKLSQGSIVEEMSRAEMDVREHFRENPRLKRDEIGLGGDEDLLDNEEMLDYFAGQV